MMLHGSAGVGILGAVASKCSCPTPMVISILINLMWEAHASLWNSLIGCCVIWESCVCVCVGRHHEHAHGSGRSAAFCSLCAVRLLPLLVQHQPYAGCGTLENQVCVCQQCCPFDAPFCWQACRNTAVAP